MQILCKFLTSQKEANDALGPKGSLGSRKQQGKERKEGMGGDREGTRRAREGPEAFATSEKLRAQKDLQPAHAGKTPVCLGACSICPASGRNMAF